MARAVARSPELKAGCPQQAWRGTSTVQPASSSSFAAAKPIDGRIMSTRQVTKRPTRLAGSAIEAPGAMEFVPRHWRKGRHPASGGVPDEHFGRIWQLAHIPAKWLPVRRQGYAQIETTM